ncbi:MAG: hypothetical protein ACT4PT_10545 [Methanobacteriota archaeon]
MQSRVFQRLVRSACLAMALMLVLLQFVLTPEAEAPWPLFVVFLALWIFGAVMVTMRPMFGAAGTAAWGVLAAAGAWQSHQGALDAEDVSIMLGSLITAALAAAYLIRLRSPSADG